MKKDRPPPAVRRKAPVPLTQCGMALTADMLGDRWTLLILREAFYGVQRFDDIHKDLGAPRATLAGRLSMLVQIGLLDRQPYQEAGSRTRHAYILTEAGRDFATPLIALMQWGDTHIQGGNPKMKLIDAKSGERVYVHLLSETGKPVAPENLTIIPNTKR